MIDKTYGHMLPDSPEHIRALLNADEERGASAVAQ